MAFSRAIQSQQEEQSFHQGTAPLNHSPSSKIREETHLFTVPSQDGFLDYFVIVSAQSMNISPAFILTFELTALNSSHIFAFIY